jgi:hypothetical protein
MIAGIQRGLSLAHDDLPKKANIQAHSFEAREKRLFSCRVLPGRLLSHAERH